ncbi:MAG: M36 family metallopeptidase [bacterium]|nr:M36 family metallopeptidase [bacterium]
MIRPERTPGIRRLFDGRDAGSFIRWERPAAPPSAPEPEVAPPGDGALAGAARRFLLDEGPRLGVADPSLLRLVRVWRSRSGTHVRFQEDWGGAPVIGGIIGVHLDGAGAVYAVTGSFREAPRAAAPGAQPVTRKQAVAAALADLGAGLRLRGRTRVREVVLASAAGLVPAYKVTVPAAAPLGTWIYLVDARSGGILRVYNSMRFAVGRGRVYLLSPIEDPELREVALERLDGVTELKGAHVVVVNEDYAEATSPDGAFIYDPAETHFDEVMAYYHVDRIAAHLSGIDPHAAAGAITANVHAGDRMDNAYYDPSTGGIYFGDGGGPGRMNPLSREAAVICHEYTHAVLDRINPHLKGREADALHEGYADYFGCSLTDDAQIGEWVVAPRGDPHLRDLTNGKRYPADMTGDAHADGEIWGAACWDLRRSLGAAAADTLAYESMHFLPEFARFADAAFGIERADGAVFGGAHAAAIGSVLRARGLGGGAEGRR